MEPGAVCLGSLQVGLAQISLLKIRQLQFDVLEVQSRPCNTVEIGTRQPGPGRSLRPPVWYDRVEQACNRRMDQRHALFRTQSFKYRSACTFPSINRAASWIRLRGSWCSRDGLRLPCAARLAIHCAANIRATGRWRTRQSRRSSSRTSCASVDPPGRFAGDRLSTRSELWLMAVKQRFSTCSRRAESSSCDISSFHRAVRTSPIDSSRAIWLSTMAQSSGTPPKKPRLSTAFNRAITEGQASRWVESKYSIRSSWPQEAS